MYAAESVTRDPCNRTFTYNLHPIIYSNIWLIIDIFLIIMDQNSACHYAAKTHMSFCMV